MGTALILTLVGMAVSWLFLTVLVAVTRQCAFFEFKKIRCHRPKKASTGTGDDELQIAVAIATAMAHARS